MRSEMKKWTVYSLTIFIALCSCREYHYYDGPLPGSETTDLLKNDKTFIVGRWSLARTFPNYDSDSWIKFCDDDTFTAYFCYPSKPYSEKISGSYTYADAAAICTVIHNPDSTSTRKLEFTTIVGRTSTNKARLIYPIDGTGSTDTLNFEFCNKK